MKFQVSFKSPDAVDYALEDVPEDERNDLREFMKKWVKYGEYITVEFDIEEGTCVVVEQ